MRTTTFLFAVLFSLMCNAQAFFIDLHGIVTDHYTGIPLKGVLVNISSTDQIVDLVTKKDGSYRTHLIRGVKYDITYSKKGCIAKRMQIDGTNIPEQPDAPFYDMDVQMTMFEEIPNMDFTFFEEPLGRAEYKHSVRNLSWENEFSKEQRHRLSGMMRHYHKMYTGYYQRSAKKVVVIADSLLVLTDSADNSVVEKALRDFIPLDSSYYNDQSAAPARQVENIVGLFYTVQVGVYSKPTPLDELYSITMLNSELLEDGKIRYTSGIYSTIEAVGLHRKMIMLAGVKDAFIVAYFNGKRVPMEDALYLSEKFGSKLYPY